MAGNVKLSQLHIGTSGWSYKHWSGLFYPQNIRPDTYLEYYVTKFHCVELNSSFYHLPKKMTIAGWMKRTPETFWFCPKLSRFITHRKRLVDCEEALKRYFDIFEGMKKRLGPVLIQLPPGLSFDESLVRNFLMLLHMNHSDYRFAFEVRHSSWITDSFLNILTQYGIAFVIADSGSRFPYHEAVTADFVYLRFHGHEKLYASDYSMPELKQYAEKIIKWLNNNKKVWVFFNNDYNGFALKNAMELREIIRSSV
jgi:uncharacterized protein YecE (DUF72 family)